MGFQTNMTKGHAWTRAKFWPTCLMPLHMYSTVQYSTAQYSTVQYREEKRREEGYGYATVFRSCCFLACSGIGKETAAALYRRGAHGAYCMHHEPCCVLCWPFSKRCDQHVDCSALTVTCSSGIAMMDCHRFTSRQAYHPQLKCSLAACPVYRILLSLSAQATVQYSTPQLIFKKSFADLLVGPAAVVLACRSTQRGQALAQELQAQGEQQQGQQQGQSGSGCKHGSVEVGGTCSIGTCVHHAFSA